MLAYIGVAHTIQHEVKARNRNETIATSFLF